MELDPEEVKRGHRWLFIAGTVAVLFAFTLYNIDKSLHSSTYEADKYRLLNTLRSAQHSLPSRSVDSRQSQEEVYRLKVVTNEEARSAESDIDAEKHH